MSVGVLDFGIGNVGSILSMHRRLMIPAERVVEPAQLAEHERFILPGVGAFDRGMRRLRESGLDAPLRELVIDDGRPLLGICLGMQMLAEGSEEGERSETGLGWVPGVVRSMRPVLGPTARLPFMGWAYVDPVGDPPLFASDAERERFYFVHSYAFVPTEPTDVIATVDHGVAVCAAVRRANVFGTQFHPEKSHRFGMALLRSFAAPALTV